ncbi:unnamed protein product [Blepharisma stoltei]|uniref:C2H2-type domain-containing protein n=1 Tax=Blepharisma stoltei TaxID=1481888 RepID=A0AAU9IP38_9CILI|nr:unnamed protein product [Blepharisma stoltei]
MDQVRVSSIVKDNLRRQPTCFPSKEKIRSFFDLCDMSFQSLTLLRDYMVNEFMIERDIITILNTELGLDPNTPSPKQVGSSKKSSDKVNCCPICNKIFNSNQGLSQHMGKKHSASIKNSLCDICGKLFTHKYALKFHYQQVHETARRVGCKECSYVAYNKYKLQRHMKRHAICSKKLM